MGESAVMVASDRRQKTPRYECGRTARKRKKKTQTVAAISVACDPVIVRLHQWLCCRRWNKSSHCNLRPAVFQETGRGLLTTQAVSAGQVVVSIPGTALVTCNLVLAQVPLKFSFQDPHSKFRAMEILSFFLLYHKYLGEESEWKPYLDSLPENYTVPAYCTREEINAFPELIRCRIIKQDEDVSACYSSIQKMILSNSKIHHVFSSLCLDDVRWSWFTVNTRAVYHKNSRPSLVIMDDDVYALAPYLDLLNHSHCAQVTADMNYDTGCYEIVTHVPYGSYQQVFINYGPHDNIKLYIEYGFILSDNPHSSVPISLDNVVSAVENVTKDTKRKAHIQEKCRVVYANGMDKNLGVSQDGPSWNLEVAATVLLMTPEELRWWQIVFEDLRGVAHRQLVVECLALVIQQQAHQLSNSITVMTHLTSFSQALAVGRGLLEECCAILNNAKMP